MVIAPASRSNKRGLKPENGKIAGGLRARRGSNPFPGAKKLFPKECVCKVRGPSRDCLYKLFIQNDIQPIFVR